MSDTATTLPERMREHAGDHQHLYGYLMRAMADDYDADGPVREICRGWEDAPPGAIVQLRLLAGLFRIVLTGRAPQLERFYPCLGGTAPPSQAWPEVRQVLAAHVSELHEALEIAPQTNEVGRSTALLIGIFAAVHASGLARIRLYEPGASAGLNLLVDRFRFTGAGWAYGPEDSPVRLSGVNGAVLPASFTVVDRRGCDLSPVDVTDEAGRLRLRSFVWPFHIERHALLAAALAVAQADPPEIDRAGAGEWLESVLDEPCAAGELTVVWHSVTRLYWPSEEIDRVAAAVEAASARRPLAYVTMEYPRAPRRTSTSGTQLSLRLWAGAARGEPQVLGSVGDHGVPVTLTSSVFR